MIGWTIKQFSPDESSFHLFSFLVLIVYILYNRIPIYLTEFIGWQFQPFSFLLFTMHVHSNFIHFSFFESFGFLVFFNSEVIKLQLGCLLFFDIVRIIDGFIHFLSIDILKLVWTIRDSMVLLCWDWAIFSVIVYGDGIEIVSNDIFLFHGCTMSL